MRKLVILLVALLAISTIYAQTSGTIEGTCFNTNNLVCGNCKKYKGDLGTSMYSCTECSSGTVQTTTVKSENNKIDVSSLCKTSSVKTLSVIGALIAMILYNF